MQSITDIDFGTPRRSSEKQITLEIDGVNVTVPDGTSVMHAAAAAGRQVPKLCATDSLEAFGSCRLCLVEIDGRRGTPASCTTPAENGMKVHTQTDRRSEERRVGKEGRSRRATARAEDDETDGRRRKRYER